MVYTYPCPVNKLNKQAYDEWRPYRQKNGTLNGGTN